MNDDETPTEAPEPEPDTTESEGEADDLKPQPETEAEPAEADNPAEGDRLADLENRVTAFESTISDLAAKLDAIQSAMADHVMDGDDAHADVDDDGEADAFEGDGENLTLDDLIENIND